MTEGEKVVLWGDEAVFGDGDDVVAWPEEGFGSDASGGGGFLDIFIFSFFLSMLSIFIKLSGDIFRILSFDDFWLANVCKTFFCIRIFCDASGVQTKISWKNNETKKFSKKYFQN